jgi:F-type H+-transporting ATPase subunit b
MNRSRRGFRGSRAARLLLAVLGFLSVAGFAYAAGEGEAHHGVGAVPWVDIVKQAVNFAILAGALVYLLRKPLSTYLRERSESLRKSIEAAASAREEAARKLAAVEERAARVAEEIAQLNAKMDAEAKVEAQTLHEAATAEIARIRSQAEFAAEQEVKKARQELQAEASDLAARAAEELVRKNLSPEDQERLVRENLEKIEGIVR